MHDPNRDVDPTAAEYAHQEERFGIPRESVIEPGLRVRPSLSPQFPNIVNVLLPFTRPGVEFWHDRALFERRQDFYVAVEDRDHLREIAWSVKAMMASIDPATDCTDYEPWLVIEVGSGRGIVLELREPRPEGENEYAVYADDQRYAMPL